MINREHQLIAKVVHQGNFRTVVKSRINKTMFASPECRAAFRYLWEYYYHPKHPGRVPKKRFFAEKFPAFPKNVPTKGASIEELCERVRESAISRRILTLNDDLAVMADKEPLRALELLRDSIPKIQSMTAMSNSISLSEMADDLLSEYDLVSKHGGMTGIPFPWQELNAVTGGMHEEDLILMYADHKTMKSFLGLLMACFAYRNGRRRVLYYAAEMNRMLIGRRAAACFCELDYESIRRATLSKEQYVAYNRTLHMLTSWQREMLRNGKVPDFYIVKDGGNEQNSIYQLHAEVEIAEPDVIFVDSFYRMAGDYDWKVQAQLTRNLKATGERYKVPVVAITQRNRDQKHGAGDRGMGDVGYTLAGAQETDLGMRIIYDGEQEDGSAKLHFIIAAAREIKEKGFTIEFSPYTKYKWVGWLTEEDLEDLSARLKEKKKRRKSVEEEGSVHRAAAEVYGAALTNLHNSVT